jgi:hypothetical protein
MLGNDPDPFQQEANHEFREDEKQAEAYCKRQNDGNITTHF